MTRSEVGRTSTLRMNGRDTSRKESFPYIDPVVEVCRNRDPKRIYRVPSIGFSEGWGVRTTKKRLVSIRIGSSGVRSSDSDE